MIISYNLSLFINLLAFIAAAAELLVYIISTSFLFLEVVLNLLIEETFLTFLAALAANLTGTLFIRVSQSL